MTIAIYHCSIKIISRGKGESAVAAAAYRSGEKLTNDYDGTTHDFTRKGGVVHTEILLPDNAPREYADRSMLSMTFPMVGCTAAVSSHVTESVTFSK